MLAFWFEIVVKLRAAEKVQVFTAKETFTTRLRCLLRILLLAKLSLVAGRCILVATENGLDALEDTEEVLLGLGFLILIEIIFLVSALR